MLRSLVGSEMCIRDRVSTQSTGEDRRHSRGMQQPEEDRPSALGGGAVEFRRLSSGVGPAARCGHCLTLVNEHLLVTFGDSGKNPHVQRVYYNDIWSFSIRKSSWQQVTFDNSTKREMDGRSHHAAASIRNDRGGSAVIVFGGADGAKCFDETLVLQNSSERGHQWEVVKGSGPCARRGHTLTPLDTHRLVMFGGTTRTASFNDLFVFDAAKMKWLPVVGVTGEPPSPRAFHSASLVQNNLIVTGGTNGDRVYGPSFDFVHAFDITTGAWSEITAVPEPGLPPRFAHSAAVLGGDIVVFGGLNPFGVTTSTQTPAALVITASGSWSPLEVEGPDIGARAYLTVEPSGDVVYIFGGYKPGSMGCSSSLYCMIMAPSKVANSPEIAPRRGLHFNDQITVMGPEGDNGTMIERQLSFKAHHFQAAFKRVEEVSPELLGARAETERIEATVIQQLMKPATWNPPRHRDFVLQLGQIQELCNRAEKLIKAESSLLEVKAPCKVFGDIHGQFGDLMQFFKSYGEPSFSKPAGDLEKFRYLFLGDYVDRGSHSLETVSLLLALKLQHPESVYLLRGNHESAETNRSYGFKEECEERLGESAGTIAWELFNRVFNWMPPAAIIDRQILAVHGGIGTHVSTLANILEAPRGRSCMDSGSVMIDLLWSDPTEHDGIEGGHDSPRGVSSAFGPDRVKEFLDRNELMCIIRAHQCVMDGFEVFASGHLITIFSATNYCGVEGNAGAICIIGKDGQVSFKVIQPRSRAQIPDLQDWLESNQQRPPTPTRRR
eukprot:TRINITY_DN24169_c0_g1_i2.p1 TRINITY_DN24169_c0_g1~~TRINITY_DN24169_c0_g1_i2.p1  ORF type:complete len:778 (-),score=155.46 TRINITY_DN24169_c0_g1_i2:429-2762(-)